MTYLHGLALKPFFSILLLSTSTFGAKVVCPVLEFFCVAKIGQIYKLAVQYLICVYIHSTIPNLSKL